jgi:hypothetical protein
MTTAHQVRAQPERLRDTTWKEYGVRFLFGGVITALVGVVGKAFGPVVAGLFLAFPAILPASVTLVERHQHRPAAGVNSLGAAVGSIGLLAFGAAVWWLAPHTAGWLVLVVGTIVWLGFSVGLWMAFEWSRRAGRPG